MKAHVFLDTGIVLDFFLGRDPAMLASARLLSLAAKGQIRVSVSSVSLANIAFLLGRTGGRKNVERDILELLDFVKVVPCSEAMFAKATEVIIDDFENALQYVCALHAKCTLFVSNQKYAFASSTIPVMDSAEAILTIKESWRCDDRKL